MTILRQATGPLGRRPMVLALGALTAAWPLRRAGAAGSPVRIALLGGGEPADSQESFRVFTEELAAVGLRDGREVVLDVAHARYAPDLAERNAALAASRGAGILVAGGIAIAAAAQFKPPLPVVVVQSGDPVIAGFAESFARPGRNVTGLSMMAVDLIPKRLELLWQFQPASKTVAFLASPEHAGQQRELAASKAGAARLGLQVRYHEVRTPQQVDAALVEIAQERPGAVLLFSDALMVGQRRKLADFFLRQRIPSAAGWRAFPESGHLISYGPERNALWRRAARIVANIVHGASPAEIPIELPTVVELVLNRTTAQAMGLKLPAGLLARADQVLD